MSEEDRIWELLTEVRAEVKEIRRNQENFKVAYTELKADHETVKRESRTIAMKVGAFFSAVGAAMVAGFLHWFEAWRG